MKRLILSTIVILMLGLYFESNAQSEGTVSYIETNALNMPAEVRAMRPDMPTESESQKLLKFSGQISEYIVDPNKKEDESNGRRRFFRMNQVDPILYYNHEAGEKRSKLDGFGKEFIVEEEPEDRKWKIVATEQRDIKGYTCMKAILADTTMTEAWFTPQIPASYGPAEFFGLPGLILAVSVGEERVILAQNIDLETEVEELKEPKGGKRLTREKYDELMIEKRKEMEAMWQNGNRRRFGG